MAPGFSAFAPYLGLVYAQAGSPRARSEISGLSGTPLFLLHTGGETPMPEAPLGFLLPDPPLQPVPASKLEHACSPARALTDGAISTGSGPRTQTFPTGSWHQVTRI